MGQEVSGEVYASLVLVFFLSVLTTSALGVLTTDEPAVTPDPVLSGEGIEVALNISSDKAIDSATMNLTSSNGTFFDGISMNRGAWPQIEVLPGMNSAHYSSVSIQEEFLAYGNGTDIVVYNRNDWTVEKRIKDPDNNVFSVLFSPNGSYIVATPYIEANYSSMLVYNTSDWSMEKNLTLNNYVTPDNLDFSGNLLAYSTNRTVVRNMSDNWNSIKNLTYGGGGDLYTADISPDGGHVAYGGGNNNSVYVYDTSDWNLDKKLNLTTAANVIEYSPDSSSLAVGQGSGNISIFDTGNWNNTANLTEPERPVNTLEFNEGKWMLAGSSDNNAYVYQTDFWTHRRTLDSSTDDIWSVDIESGIAAYLSYEGDIFVNQISLNNFEKTYSVPSSPYYAGEWSVNTTVTSTNSLDWNSTKFSVQSPPIIEILEPSKEVYINTDGLSLNIETEDPNSDSYTCILENNSQQFMTLDESDSNVDTGIDLSDDTYNISVSCDDNKGVSYDSVQFKVDTTPPVRSEKIVPGEVTRESEELGISVFWEDKLSDLGIGYTHTNISGEWELASSKAFESDSSWLNQSFSTSGLAGKTVCWYQLATDAPGNLNESNGEGDECTYISNPPEISIHEPKDTYSVSEVNVNISVEDPEADEFTCQVYDESSQIGTLGSTETFFTTSLNKNAGTHELSVDCTEDPGLQSSSVQEYTVTNQAPDIQIQDPGGSYNTSEVPVEVVTSDVNDDSYTCDIFESGTLIDSFDESNPTYKGLLDRSEGAYSLKVECSDGEDNIQVSSSFEVDLTEPAVKNESDDSGGEVYEQDSVKTSVLWEDQNLQEARLLTDASGTMTQVASKNLGSPEAWFNSSIDTAGNAGDQVCWEQQGLDDAGNSRKTSQKCFYVNDLPDISIQSPSTLENSADIWANVSTSDIEDESYSCTLNLDGVEINTLDQNSPESSQLETDLSQGSHTLEVSCTQDTASSSKSLSFTVDSVNPENPSQGDTSYGKVPSGEQVNLSGYWRSADTDLTTGDLRFNGSGTWATIEDQQFSSSTSWFNYTVNTSEYVNDYVCWNQRVEDEAGNIGTSGEACFDIVGEDEDPPSFNSAEDDSAGLVDEGITVNVSVKWDDALSRLSEGFFHENSSGTWAMTTFDLDGNSTWLNTTIQDTIGNEYVCWRQEAEDSFGNRQTSMSERCFEISNIDDQPPDYSKLGDDSSGDIEEGSIIDTSAYWNDSKGLSNGVVEENSSGTWENVEQKEFDTSQAWLNATIDTSGVEETVCWRQKVEDVYKNENTTDAKCVNIKNAPRYTDFTVESPESYSPGTSTNISVNWSDPNSNFDESVLTANFTGTDQNYTGSEYSEILDAGTYRARFYGKDTDGLTNQTDENIFRVSNATPELSISSNVSGNVVYPKNVKIDWSCETSVECKVYSEQFGFIEGDRFTSTLSSGTYEWKINTSGNSNYREANKTVSLTVEKASPFLNLSSNVSWSTVVPEVVEIMTEENNTGDKDVAYRLYQGSDLISSPFEALLSAGTYRFHYLTSGGVNWTSRSISDTLEIRLNTKVKGIEDSPWKTSGGSIDLNVLARDTEALSDIKTKVYLENQSERVYAGSIQEDTALDSKKEWFNGTVDIPYIKEGNTTVTVKTEGNGKQGINQEHQIRVDNTPPSLNLSVSSADIQLGESIETTCGIKDEGIGVSNMSLELITPEEKRKIRCGNSILPEEEGSYRLILRGSDLLNNTANISRGIQVDVYRHEEDEEKEENDSKQENSTSPVKDETVSFKQPGKDIDSIEILGKDLTNVSLEVKEVDTPEEDIEDREIYRYLEINIGQNTSIKSANITFSVDKEWLKDRDADKVILEHYRDGWEKLDTEIVNRSEEKVLYTAQTFSFSNFAITAPQIEKVTKTEECSFSELQHCGETITQYLTGIALILILALLARRYLNQKKEESI